MRRESLLLWLIATACLLSGCGSKPADSPASVQLSGTQKEKVDQLKKMTPEDRKEYIQKHPTEVNELMRAPLPGADRRKSG